eukprot:Skav232142  [mRNA]  locus=scaffold1744:248819:250783:- [translate_table: standard]
MMTLKFALLLLVRPLLSDVATCNAADFCDDGLAHDFAAAVGKDGPEESLELLQVKQVRGEEDGLWRRGRRAAALVFYRCSPVLATALRAMVSFKCFLALLLVRAGAICDDLEADLCDDQPSRPDFEVAVEKDGPEESLQFLQVKQDATLTDATEADETWGRRQSLKATQVCPVDLSPQQQKTSSCPERGQGMARNGKEWQGMARNGKEWQSA